MAINCAYEQGLKITDYILITPIEDNFQKVIMPIEDVSLWEFIKIKFKKYFKNEN